MNLQSNQQLLETLRETKSRAEGMIGDLIAIRRDLHMHPEQRFQEVRTAGIVAAELEKLGAEIRTGVGKTGVVGVIRGTRGEGKVLGIRCDMDALPVFEKNDIPYKSRNEGTMHACGHDVHTATGIGAARLLAGMRERFRGAVKFIFQPSEENPVGWVCGAQEMINDGVLENPALDAILSLHCWPDLAAGAVGVAAGPAMAGSEAFRITMTGRSAHTASPQKGRDAILGAAEVISSAYHIIPRMIDPAESVAMNIGFIEGGSKLGIIANKVIMEGSVRALSREMLDFVRDRIKDAAEGVSRTLGLENEVSIEGLYPPVVNDAALNDIVTAVSAELLGQENVIPQLKCPMTSEDFSLFSTKVPAYYLKVGTSGGENTRFPLHSDHFDVEERSIAVGASVLAASALAFLEG
ncbi:MAG: M20 metallopeptidase family protein [Candidatus Latescibacterota bacterium]